MNKYLQNLYQLEAFFLKYWNIVGIPNSVVNAKMNWVTFKEYRGKFVSLSCIVETLLDLCECQVIIEETVPV